MINKVVVKSLMKKNKLKGYEVSRILGITYQSFYNKMNNTQEITANELFKLCKLLNCNWEKIFKIDI